MGKGKGKDGYIVFRTRTHSSSDIARGVGQLCHRIQEYLSTTENLPDMYTEQISVQIKEYLSVENVARIGDLIRSRASMAPSEYYDIPVNNLRCPGQHFYHIVYSR